MTSQGLEPQRRAFQRGGPLARALGNVFYLQVPLVGEWSYPLPGAF